VYEGNTTKEPQPSKWMMWHASMGTMPGEVGEVVPGFPEGLSGVILKLMAKGVGERYKSAEEVLADLGKGGAVEGAAPPLPVKTVAPAARGAAVGQKAAPVTAAPAAAKGGGEKYWVRLRGKTTGPFEFSELQRQVKSGAVSRFHQVSVDQVNWKAATSVEGLWGPAVV
jgi:hypothetical protein